MDSDSDHFESADEDFVTDEEETNTVKQHSIEKQEPKTNTPTILDDVKNDVTLIDSNEVEKLNINTSTEDSNKLEQKCEINKNDNNTTNIDATSTVENNSNIIKNKNVDDKQIHPKTRVVVERRERPQKREPKTKLGTKLNVEDKNKAFWEAYTEAKKNEYGIPPQRVTCWEEGVNCSSINQNIDSDLYSEKSKEPEQNFWDNEENYMELPRDEKTELQPDKQESKEESSWGGWGNWGGMSSLLNTAQLSVSTISNITSSVSHGVTKVLETGIGIPDPEELAKLDREKESSNEKDAEPKEHENQQEQRTLGFGLGNFVSGVSHITKLVESTGSKVLTGGLDTLEVIGKKTMEVLQEGDPGLKKKRALFKIDQNKPVLSQILREAKEKAEEEDKINEGQRARKPHYETIFDDYQGLVHLEALEMLSKQCDIKLETLIETLKGSALQDMQETMAQIKELCELPDEEEDTSLSDIEVVREKVETAINEMNVQITYNHFLETWSAIDVWLQENHENPNEIHQKAIESLAQLTAIAVEQFHKAGELLLVKERRSTVDEADSLLQLTITLTGVVGAVAGKFSEKLNVSVKDSNENVNSLITNIFLEAANSSTYMQDAFNLLIPVLQVGAI